MTAEYSCYRHGPHLGAVCPHCERLEALESARREDERRDEDRDRRRQEEQRERDAREAELRAEDQDEAWRRHSDALQAQEEIAAQADARARLAASGVLRASELARSALVALKVGDTPTALAQIEEARATAPTYAWVHLAHALIVLRAGVGSVGPILQRSVALALAGGTPDVEPLPIGERGPIQGRGDAFAYALVPFGEKAADAARQILESGLVSDPAAYALAACLPGYADQLLADLADEGVLVKRAIALPAPMQAFERFARRWSTWDARLELARTGPPHERWSVAQELRRWREEWKGVISDVNRHIETLEHTLSAPEPYLPSLNEHVADAGRSSWNFDAAWRMIRWSAWLIGLSLPCICGAPWYAEGATGRTGWIQIFSPPIVATCIGALLVGSSLVEAWLTVNKRRDEARRGYPDLVANIRTIAAGRERGRAELGHARTWLAAAMSLK